MQQFDIKPHHIEQRHSRAPELRILDDAERPVTWLAVRRLAVTALLHMSATAHTQEIADTELFRGSSEEEEGGR